MIGFAAIWAREAVLISASFQYVRRHPYVKGRKNNILQVTLKCSPMTDVIVSLEP